MSLEGVFRGHAQFLAEFVTGRVLAFDGEFVAIHSPDYAVWEV